jgi:DNA-binding LytR/AlgR family response regulator
MNVLICDDMANDANELAEMLASLGFEIQTSIFTDPFKTLRYIQSGALVDVCFLDIVMPDMSGIMLAEKLREIHYAGEIVFLTTFNNFASQSYQVKAFSYMLKPVNGEKLSNVISRLQDLIINTDEDGLSVKTQGSASVIPFRNISYVEADHNTIYINLLDQSVVKEYVALGKIAEQLLQDNRFGRCHRSFIVNLNEIKTIANNEVVMKSGKSIPISRGYLQVKDKIVKWMFKGKL